MVSIPDIEQWDAAVLEQVKNAALAAGRSLSTLNEGLGAIKTDLGAWHGDAANAWRAEHDKAMVAVDDQHRETGSVADIIDTAIEDVRWCICELQDAREPAEALGMTIAPDGTVTDPEAGTITDEQVAREREHVRAATEERLKALLVKANATDVEIGNALRAAVGDTPLHVPDGAPHTDPAVILAELQRANDQAVVDQMNKIHGIQKQIDEAAKVAYTHNPGSAESDAALQKMQQLKGEMATALNDLGKIPDYSKVDPKSVTVTPDGHFLFNQTENGVTTQVYGQFKNGTGQFFDQAKGTSYSFTNGKLTGMTTPDPGRVTPDDELLFNAVTTAVGAPEAAVAMKGGGEAAIQGFKALFGREAFAEAGGITGENVIPKALVAAEARADEAAANLSHHPLPVNDHPLPPASADRPLPLGGEHPPVTGGSHGPASADGTEPRRTQLRRNRRLEPGAESSATEYPVHRQRPVPLHDRRQRSGNPHRRTAQSGQPGGP